MKKTAPEPPRSKAVHMLYESELLEQLEDYRFRNRFPSRAEAIKALLRKALEGESAGKKSSGKAAQG